MRVSRGIPRFGVLLCLLPVWATGAGASPFGVTLSTSPTDPYEHELTGQGSQTVYLWLACVQPGEYQGHDVIGLYAVEFGFVQNGPVILGLSPMSGFLNAGTPTDPVLVVGGCPQGPIVMAALTIFALPGTICFGPSTGGVQAAVDCSLLGRSIPFAWVGLGVGEAPCSEGELCPNSLQLEKTAFAAGTVVREGGGHSLKGTVAEWGVVGSVDVQGSYTLTEGYWSPLQSLAPTTVPGEPPTAAEFANAVFQSFPNPFRDRAAVAFTVARRARVRLDVYDVTGRLVTRLVDEPREAGRHIVYWGGRDRSGMPVASGVYFYRLRIGNWSDTRRMLKLR
jgi:hypothetical protein